MHPEPCTAGLARISATAFSPSSWCGKRHERILHKCCWALTTASMQIILRPKNTEQKRSALSLQTTAGSTHWMESQSRMALFKAWCGLMRLGRWPPVLWLSECTSSIACYEAPHFVHFPLCACLFFEYTKPPRQTTRQKEIGQSSLAMLLVIFPTSVLPPRSIKTLNQRRSSFLPN